MDGYAAEAEAVVAEAEAVVAVAEGLVGAVDGEEDAMRRFLLKTLMLIWRSITQKQCRQIDRIFLFCWSAITSAVASVCLMMQHSQLFLCIATNILLFREKDKKVS